MKDCAVSKQPEISPLPWHIEKSEMITAINDSNDFGVCLMDGVLEARHIDAAFVVLACNSHQALVEELRRFVEYYAAEGRSAQLGNGEAFQHWDRSRRLLAALATGQERL